MKLKLFIITIFIIFISTTCLATTDFIWSNTSTILTNANTSNESLSNSLELESGSAILIEQNSGQILYEHNSHEQLRPASVTKIMSILLIMEAIDSGQLDLSDNISCSEKASSMGGSQIWLDTTETLDVDNMLKAICVVSANDCTVAMAEHICGSEEAFVEKMNSRAKELGMNDTFFKNCHGIDEDGHVTSAYDISIMSKELLTKHPTITNYTTIWMDNLRDGKSELVNTNKLVRNYSGCTGLKTGSTSLALYNLSASATRDNLSLIAVIMKAPTTKTRFAEAQKLLDYGFANYSYKELGKSNDVLKEIPVSKGISKTVNVIYSNSAHVLTDKWSDGEITQTINLPESLNAPIEEKQKVGEIIYSTNDKIVGQVDLLAESSIKKQTAWNMTTYTLRKMVYII